MHAHAGYTVVLLVTFRVVWGFVGTTHARFVDFIPTPKITGNYLQHFIRRRAEPYTGHDPLGALMIFSLLTCLLITGFSGMALFAMEGSGPLANTLTATLVATWPGALIENVHDFFAHLTMILVIVHITGVLVTSILHKENLIIAMITGRKKSRSQTCE